MSIAAIKQKIHDQDPSIRRQAVKESMPFVAQQEIAELLCEALSDTDKGVQNTAMRVLSSACEESAVEALIKRIATQDLNLRNAAMTILRNLGPAALKHLEKALKDSNDVDEIIQLLVVIGDIASPLGTASITSYLEHEDDNVCTTAVESLGKIQDPDSAEVLLELYEKSDILKYSIVEALGNIASEKAEAVLMNAIKSEDTLEYFTAIGALGSFGSTKALPILFEKMQEDESIAKLAVKSIAQIEEVNPGSVKKLDKKKFAEILLPLLENLEETEYAYFVKVASALADPVYIASLIKALAHKDNDIVNEAAEGLAAHGVAVVDQAVKLMPNLGSQAKIQLLRILGKSPSEKTPKALANLAFSEDDEVRQALAETLGFIPTQASFSILRNLLDDSDETVRKNAVISMSEMLNFDGALTALINKFKDMNGHVRREACKAMAKSSSDQVVEPLFNVIKNEPYGDVREAAATVLAARKDHEITRRLIELLDSPNSRIRETISRTIWHCSSKFAVDSLIPKLEDKEWRIAVNSCYSLGKLKDLKSIFPLKESLKNPDWQIRIAALSALREFKSKELKKFFFPMVKDENPLVAKLAVAALGDLDDKNVADELKPYFDRKDWTIRLQIVKSLGKLDTVMALPHLKDFAEKDSCAAVKTGAVHALIAMKDFSAKDIVAKYLDSEDENMLITAIKYFKNSDDSEIKDKIKNIFLYNKQICNYFVETAALNSSPLIDNIFAEILPIRAQKRIKALKAAPENPAMNPEELLLMKSVIAQKCGLEVNDGAMIESKLRKNLDSLFITSWSEYYNQLRYTEEGDIFTNLFDAITDPQTSFFAETDQIQAMISDVLPAIIEQRSKDGDGKLRILSVGTSYGPEAYSLAINVIEDLHPDNVEIEVTGIDISNICLNTAKRGIYKREMFRNVDQKYIDLYFEDDRGDLRVKDEIKNKVNFIFANAINEDEIDALGRFDLIVCRNLLRDFSQEARMTLAENIYNILAPGGALFISSDESLYDVSKAFRLKTYENVVAYKKL